uniref:Glutamate receptor ionotropic, NMDA 2B n=1 Tax=Timema cristinae TaxID=61476 RepID=A0A7R9GRD8_TIMCR|nr:unnamed protein product [Timema cristinae]
MPEPTLREQQCSLYLAVPPSSPPPSMCACAQQLNTSIDITMAHRNGSFYQCCSGFCIDLLQKFSDELGFTYELVRVEDGRWGTLENGKWNGLIADLVNRKTDMVMTSLMINSEREAVVDFTVPFMETGIAILVAKRTGIISPTAFLEPFDTASWMLVGVVAIQAATFTIFLFEWLSPSGFDMKQVAPAPNHRFSLFRTYWLVWAVLFQAAVHVDSPRGFTARFMTNVWAMFAVVFLAIYTANLAAFMITREEFHEFSGIDDHREVALRVSHSSLMSSDRMKPRSGDWAGEMEYKLRETREVVPENDTYRVPLGDTPILVCYHHPVITVPPENTADIVYYHPIVFQLAKPFSNKPMYKFGTIPWSHTDSTLNKYFKEMHAYMRTYNRTTVAEGIVSVLNGELDAFIYDGTVLDYLVAQDEDCRLLTVGSWYAMTGYGLAFTRNSKHVGAFNKRLLDFRENGDLERLRRYWMTGTCKPGKQEHKSSDPLALEQFLSAFLLLMSGILLAAMLLLLEHMYFKYVRKRLAKTDRGGCCALISLSMGKSLTFRGAVFEAQDILKNHRCTDPICDTHLWKVKHELDMARMKIRQLQKELEMHGIKPSKSPAAIEASPPRRRFSSARTPERPKQQTPRYSDAFFRYLDAEDVLITRDMTRNHVSSTEYSGRFQGGGQLFRPCRTEIAEMETVL